MNCLWLEDQRFGEPPVRPLTADEKADVCVVGGGFAGLWTALRLRELEPAADVTLLEAAVCGAGASGRNGGFALSWWSKIETLVKRYGDEEALRLARASEAAVDELGAPRTGWEWIATHDSQLGVWDGALATCERLGVSPFERIERGVLERSAAMVQPYALARELRRRAIDDGVEVRERSGVVDVDRERGVVRTTTGSVTAGAVVLATGAWLSRVRELRRALVVVASEIVATEPLADFSQRLPISDGRAMVHYWRPSPDGRLVFGQGGGALGFVDEPSPRRAAVLEADMRRIVPEAAGARVTHAWAGPVDRSTDGLPFFGRIGERVVYGGGFSGTGVAQSALAGRVLASLALRRDDEWSGSGLARGIPGRFPPQPLRAIGAPLVRRAVERVEAGNGAGPVARRLARLAPTSRGRAAVRGSSRRSTP